MSTPSAVVATIPTRALRCICLSDPSLSELDASLSKLKIESDNKENEPHRLPRQAKNVSISYKITSTKTTKTTPEDSQTTKKSAKELSRPESSRRIVEEIERLAVHHLCQHHAPAVHLVQAVDALGINHEAMGNNGTSKNVAAKRLREHITNMPGGLSTYLEKEASSDFLDDLVNRVLITDKDRALSRKSQKVEAVVNALQHEAMVTFFESLQEHELHKICRAMKNEGEEPETRSRSVLAASIINNQPVSELILPGVKKENKKKQLSKKKPKLVEGVSYDDVFQWYKLSELQEFAREHELKVSGKKKELIGRILAFLANGSTLPSQPRKKKQASQASKRSRSSTKNVEATPELSKRISELLEAIKKGSKAVNESLPQEEIDELEKRIRKANGSGMRLPPGLRQLYATCDGFSVHGDWTWGVNIYSSKEVNGKEDTEDFIGGDSLVKEWLESRVAEGMKPEESIAHPSWLLIGRCSEYDCLFVNIDPSSENYGAVNWATNNCDSETDHCKSVEELLEKTAAYVARREKARKKFAEEEPDADEDMLEDYVIDQIVYDEEDDDDDEDEEDDGEEEKNSDVAEDGDE